MPHTCQAELAVPVVTGLGDYSSLLEHYQLYTPYIQLPQNSSTSQNATWEFPLSYPDWQDSTHYIYDFVLVRYI